MGLRILIITILAPLLFLSCTRKVEQSQLTIKLPSAGNSPMQSVGALSSGTPWSGTITTSSEINCYAVMVGGPEATMSNNVCKEKSTGNELFKFGPWVGGVAAGSEISLDVNSGSDRTVTLIGFNSSAGGCIDFKGDGPPDGLNSHPRVIDTITMDIAGNSATAEFTVPTSLTALSEVDECDIDEIPGSGGSSGTDFWGDGRDGDLTVTGTSNLVFQTNLYSTPANITHTPASGGVASSKKFGFQTRITNISNSDGKTLTLNTVPTTAELEAGDFVLWNVVGGWAASSPDTNACDGNLYRGLWGTSKVASVSGATVVLEDEMTSNYSTINNTNVAATANEGNPHCLIQFTRVSQFGTVTLNAQLDIINAGLNAVTLGGGLTAIWIENLVLNGFNLGINMTGNGFNSATAGARGLGGSGNTPSSSESRPGYDGSGFEGGGGANAGTGGNAMLGAAQGGNALTYCSGTCFGYADKKLFYGAGGAGDGTNTGGNGGGIVILVVKSISGSGNIDINAQGANNGSGNGGGGAGGSIMVINRDRNGVQLNADVRGGTASGNGGGGGGGSISFAKCDAQQNSSPIGFITALGTSTGGGTGSLGASNSPDLAGVQSELCN